MASNPPLPDVLRLYCVVEIEGNHARTLGAYLGDPDRAHRHARAERCLVTVQPLHVVADYREDPTHGQ